jgi:ribulose-phosphate 3-epimerase
MKELLAEPRVAPSILSADFSQLGSQVDEVMAAGARVIHFDVMDGRFVPPITVGPLVASAIADRVHDASGVLDVHLMIETPERQIEAFAEAGADSITIHEEATPHANRTLGAIRELGCLAGVAINPGTPVEAIAELRGYADIVLCMTVNPGWGGQAFIEGSPDKVSRLTALVGEAAIEVDGVGPNCRRDAFAGQYRQIDGCHGRDWRGQPHRRGGDRRCERAAARAPARGAGAARAGTALL